MATISGPVGRGVAKNNPADALVVQKLLNNNRVPPLRPIATDGIVGAQTIDAIEEFQRRIVKLPHPDGRVDPNGATFKALSGIKALGWDVDKAVEYSIENKKPHYTPPGQCAMYTRKAIEAGGIVLVKHHSAKDYGSSLLAAGFHPTLPPYRKGDVVIIQGFKDPRPGMHNHPDGHMAMYDGSHWISDFSQSGNYGIYPGPAYVVYKPSYVVYRYGRLWTGGDSSRTDIA